jgi:hypothetical protein
VSLRAAGSLVQDEGLKSVAGSLTLDQDVYSLSSEVKVEEARDPDNARLTMKILTPMLQLRRPGADPLIVTGTVKVDAKGKRFNSDLTMDGAGQKTIQLLSKSRAMININMG